MNALADECRTANSIRGGGGGQIFSGRRPCYTSVHASAVICLSLWHKQLQVPFVPCAVVRGCGVFAGRHVMMGWPGCWEVQQESALSAVLALVIVAQLHCVFRLSLPPNTAVSPTGWAAGGLCDVCRMVLLYCCQVVSALVCPVQSIHLCSGLYHRVCRSYLLCPAFVSHVAARHAASHAIGMRWKLGAGSYMP
jgi:hypothetical protein